MTTAKHNALAGLIQAEDVRHESDEDHIYISGEPAYECFHLPNDDEDLHMTPEIGDECEDSCGEYSEDQEDSEEGSGTYLHEIFPPN